MSPVPNRCACLLLAAIAAVSAADDVQRLMPWMSLDGRPHPDEALVATADWTTRARQALAPRQVQTINHGWTFTYRPAEQLDPVLLAPEADDATWPVVVLPHTWHTYETTRELHPFIARPSERDARYWWHGWGVYRKRFVLDPATLADRRLFAEFDGVMKYCRVWLNGQELGDHKGGYASFSFDLTPQLRAGGNVLAVAVSARRDDAFRIPPMTAGNFDVYGGIYRDVRLVLKHAVHIPFQGSAAHEGGTFVTTPTVSAERATVRVRTWVRNDGTEARTVSLRTRLLDAAGVEVAQDAVEARVAPGVLHGFDQPGFAVDRPQLWSIETPVLYRVLSEVRVGAGIVDRLDSPLGFRWFTWNKAENRGYLNGRRLHLHGTNRHQEFPWLGDALPRWMQVRDLIDMRHGQGHNFLRTAHYTQDSLVYDLADRHGLLICEEVPNIKSIEFDDAVQRQQVIEMVRRDRNHPSIVMWSVGNETSDPADSAWVHAEDDTRIIHERHSSSKKYGSFVTHTDKHMDMENLLRCTVRGWTHRDVADHEPENGQQTGTESWQHARAQVEGGSQRGRIDMPNGNMWIYADHGADREYAHCPLLHLNPKGWVDAYRIPKYMYFLWQAFYSDRLMAFIHPHHWQTRYVGQRHDIIVDSNGESVELFANGRSLGVQRPRAEGFWHVTFPAVLVEAGELRVEAVKGGQRVTRRVVMAGAPARLTLAASHAAVAAAPDTIVLLTADVVDAQGMPVPEFSSDLHWTVEGPATLVTPATCTSDLKRRNEMYGSFYIVAPVCALVRATGGAGTITVTVASAGLASASVRVAATPVAALPGFAVEPPLAAAGRQPLAPAPTDAVTAKAARTGRQAPAAGPTVMRPATRDLVLPSGRDPAFYKGEVRKWFAAQDPAVLKRPLVFDALANAFAAHLAGNGGLLVADDINQRALQFNDACALEDGLLARHLPEAPATALRRSYARRLIQEGRTLRLADELRWIASLPADLRAEPIAEAATATALFAAWYPAAAGLPDAQRAAALARFQRLNQAVGSPPYDERDPQPIRYPVQAPLLRPTLDQLLAMGAAERP